MNHVTERQVGPGAPLPGWTDARGYEHAVQFYESDTYLLEALRHYIGAGLREGDAVVVVATERHRAALKAQLEAEELSIPGYIGLGQYVEMDAAAALDMFMRDGQPDPDLFRSTVGAVIARVRSSGRTVRVFGEMVSLLVSRQQHGAAIRLEDLWNDLQTDHPHVLCCAYPMSSFAEPGMDETFAQICTRHSHVVPAESYSTIENEGERLRTIAHLQQRAATLQREAAEALRLRDEFLVAASHDLRTPLAVILGHTQMLQRRAAGDPGDTRTSEGLKNIERRVRLMAAVVEELADATRMEVGDEIVLHRELFDLAPVLEEMVAEQQRSAPRHHLTVEIEQRPIVGFWDHARITRVIANLIGNAIKYNPDGGEITLRLRCEEGARARLSVHDAGMGIPDTDLPHIFERFFRGGNALGATSGTGIGLSTARHVVERHGGTLEVESTEDVGSIFTATLPLAPHADNTQL